MSGVGGRADENQAKADIIRQRESCSPVPICRTAKFTKTEIVSVNLSRLMAGSRRFFAGMPEWVAQRVAFGPLMPRHALRAGLVLLHRSVLAYIPMN